MDIKSEEIIRSLTLEEKARLCSGNGHWNTVSFPQKSVPGIMMTDGPHGLRKQKETEDPFDFFQSEPATCFPVACAMANSWDVELMREVGNALGDECLAQGVSVLLGPGINMKRSPLCGRNFEYFSEDPHHTAHMAAALIQGVQAQGVGCAVKHFALNNQETDRMTINVQADERALREIYLKAFAYVVQHAKPWMIMSAYNRLNGKFCSENEWLLRKILREEWGFEGLTVSDWGAVDNRVEALRAGLDLEMPESGPRNTRLIVKAVENKTLPEETLNQAAKRIVDLALRGNQNRKENFTVDYQCHHTLAKRAALESIVLMKNDNGVLPLSKKGDLAVIGALASRMRIQGAGSSRVNPAKEENLFEMLAKAATPAVGITYAQGYRVDTGTLDSVLVEEAIETARQCKSVLVLVGIPEEIESEGFDRKDMKLPDNQNRLIRELAKLDTNLVVVVVGGAPVELPWFDRVNALLTTYLGGQAMAGALVDVLYGNACPCGKLAETWPVALAHNPSYLNFPGDRKTVQYAESIFIGYRYYQKKKLQPLFPFGFGLSYTQFDYGNLNVSKTHIALGETLTVSASVTNTGSTAGKEIVQLYIAAPHDGAYPRPVRELKGFDKVMLQPGETKTVSFKLAHRDFAYYDPALRDWRVDAGGYCLQVAASSENICLEAEVEAEATKTESLPLTPWNTLGDIAAHPNGPQVLAQYFGRNKSAAENPDPHTLGVNGFDLAKHMPMKKILQMACAEDPDRAMDALLQALNTES